MCAGAVEHSALALAEYHLHSSYALSHVVAVQTGQMCTLIKISVLTILCKTGCRVTHLNKCGCLGVCAIIDMLHGRLDSPQTMSVALLVTLQDNPSTSACYCCPLCQLHSAALLLQQFVCLQQWSAPPGFSIQTAFVRAPEGTAHANSNKTSVICHQCTASTSIAVFIAVHMFCQSVTSFL